MRAVKLRPVVSKEKDGAFTFVAAGLLVLGFAIVTTRLIPARRQAAKTLGDEAALVKRIQAHDEERKRLEALDAGLEKNDPRVLERLLREQGAGRHGEMRVVVEGSSRPSVK
jgi:hypothetical protein